MKLVRLFTRSQKRFSILCLCGTVAILLAYLSNRNLSPGDGANIGGGLFLLAGSVAVFVGLTELVVITRNVWARLLLLLILISGVAWSVMSWQQGENESNKIYCEEKIALGEQIVEGQAFCDPYR